MFAIKWKKPSSPLSFETTPCEPKRIKKGKYLLSMFVILLGAFSVAAHSNTQNVESLSIEALSTKTLSLEKPRYGHGSVSDGRFVYLFGGSNDSGFIDDVEIIDTHTNTSMLLKDKTYARRYIAAVWDGEQSVYLVGGISRAGRMASVIEVFNTETHEITQLADHPFPTRTNTAAYADNKIYVFGGSVLKKREIAVVNRVYVYDIEQDSWSRAADMPVAKETRAVKYGDGIYLVGGYNYLNPLPGFQRFDLTTGDWQHMADLPVPMSSHSVVVDGDYMYTFGNYDDKDDTYRYSFEDNLWQRLDIGYESRRHTAAVKSDIGLVVSGGTLRTRNGATDSLQIFMP